MARFLHKHRRVVDRYFVVVAAALLITWLIPKEVRFKYEYELGKPWSYENLLAPFTFSISKSESEMAENRQGILDAFIPYYRTDQDVAETVISNFRASFGRSFPLLRGDSLLGLSEADSLVLLGSAIGILENIYEQGVIALDSSHHNYAGERSIYVSSGNRAARVRLSGLHSVESASAIVNRSMTAAYGPQVKRFLSERMQDALQPNLLYERTSSDQALQDQLAQISPNRGKVDEGTKIIYTGEIVTEERYQVLFSLQQEYEKYASGIQPYALWFGYFLLVQMVLIVFTLFLINFSRDVFRRWRNLVFVMLLITAFVVLTVFSESQDYPTMLILPYCIAPIIIRTFFGSRTALFTHLVILLITSFIVPNAGVFIYLHMVAGLMAIFTNLRAQYWSQFFVAIAWLYVTYSLSWMAVSLVTEGTFDNIIWSTFGSLAINVFLCLMAYPLILVFERLFGVVSDVTLRELSDLNKPLLKELSMKAPGTLQHSLQVANLAEAAVRRIGGNTLLTKVGCLYHDIGKIAHPAFFIENQASGQNPHNEMQPARSAAIIVGHVNEGIALGKRYRLPSAVMDFITTHHGTTRVEYFWRKYCEQQGLESDSSDQEFRYPGPLPYSKELAVTMIADSVEAASRTLKEPDTESIEALVEKIVEHKIADGQLRNADLTYRDVARVKGIFVKVLHSMLHVRIEYPEEPQEENTEAPVAKTASGE